jgi:formylglycine-generating enzyme required for sulfatase activity
MPELGPYLLGLYETDPDAGVHAAAAWVLRTWRKEEQLNKIDEKLASIEIPTSLGWFVNTQRQTFTIIPRRPLAAASEKELTASMPRLAIAATEVTLKQFRKFKREHKVDDNVVTSGDSPVNQVNWYQAVEYCNWLSEQERIPKEQWCYQPNKDGKLDFVPAYWNRTGYRLPTEYEWEFACRAGAQTMWGFGEADKELLGNYAWFRGNADAEGVDKCFPVGLKKPNDWGLFDMHGNLNEWCQESIDPPRIWRHLGDIECGCRGGSFAVAFPDTGCNARGGVGRNVRAVTIGFRVVRSLP